MPERPAEIPNQQHNNNEAPVPEAARDPQQGQQPAAPGVAVQVPRQPAGELEPNENAAGTQRLASPRGQ